MASVLGAFILLMITGGGIAYLGDRLGYVMGKRRVTLFGLRPRHTAQVLTVVTGVIIGGLALTLLLIVNYTFRYALLNGEELLTVNRELKQSNFELTDRANINRIIAANAQLQAKNARLVLQQSEQNLSQEQRRAELTQHQLAAKQLQLKSLSTQLVAERLQLVNVDASVKIANEHLTQAVRGSLQQLAKRRNGLLIYRDDQEIGREVISGGIGQTAIRAQLIRFLQRLSDSASTLGATLGSNNRSVVLSTIYLVDQADKSGPSPSSQAFIGESDSLDALAFNIATYGKGPVVVIAKAFGNSYSGEQVVVVVRAYANRLAIQSGTVLGEAFIGNGTENTDEIVGQIQKMLIEQVRPAAIRAGVIPTNDPQVGTVELGDVSLGQIYDVVRRVHDNNGPSLITAMASRDTYSADRLTLTFAVKPVISNIQ